MFDPFPASPPAPRSHRGTGRRASRRLDALAVDPSLGVDAAEPCPDEPPWPDDPEATRPDEHPAGAGGAGRPAPAVPEVGRLVEQWLPGRSAPWRRALLAMVARPWLALVAVGLVVAVATAIGLLSGQPAPEAAPTLRPAALPPAAQLPASGASAASVPASTAPAVPARVVVSVVGRVAHPGLVTVRAGARVADALHAAGGTLPGTNVLALNLARKLSDGEQIYVGIPVPPGATSAAGPAPGGATGGASGSATGGAPGGPGGQQKIDLNTATAAQLDELPGVGEVTAQNILDWRTKHGRFTSVGQLNEVDGIGEVRFGKLKDLVTVG